MTRSVCLAAVLSLAAAAPLAAQQDGPLATVQRLFDAMRQRDTATMRALFDTTARLVTTGTREGQPFLRVASIDGWLGAVGRATRELDERIWDPVVHIDDNLASVWVKYEFVAGGEFSHCGVDAFQLFNGATGWKIFHVADTQRREDCWHRP
ncbi:MAG: hypothetical protein ACREMJ_01505 [Gemmatimonadales bacterium]